MCVIVMVARVNFVLQRLQRQNLFKRKKPKKPKKNKTLVYGKNLDSWMRVMRNRLPLPVHLWLVWSKWCAQQTSKDKQFERKVFFKSVIFKIQFCQPQNIRKNEKKHFRLTVFVNFIKTFLFSKQEKKEGARKKKKNFFCLICFALSKLKWKSN